MSRLLMEILFYICRMINFESNTIETDKIEMLSHFETVETSLTEEFIEGRHFVCAIDEVNYEHVTGFPVEIDLEDHQITMKKLCPQIWKKGKKLFLKNLDQIHQGGDEKSPALTSMAADLHS